ncbi:MAG: Nucleotide sugar dehydrogenase [Candidatus Roizmanbacteria bacterium GW2011_GWA2_32_13]|uniref:Nucleotide sugar dehydrogenase n=1 Tax=Candidatus Roizmanbacteria bacterium GW2011_GWA2_32_13 TaxID=1618475 RepID=A0A0F9ZFD9_9BACT|nr:MAG: Nucleotide sugar dehydrogenase [Candidatus Roizmanbacteria bacterium GW2011_GWA2_32_13]
MTKKNIAVVGVGRVGLPLAIFLANEGFKVYGVSKTEGKADLLNKGTMPFMEKGAAPLLKKYVNKKLFFSIDYNCIKISDIIILTLGTPVDENMNPVLDQINDCLDSMMPLLKKNQLIILRSTVSPRTTIYVKERIEMETKFKVGKDIFLAFCPERIAEGNSLIEIKEIPQIIGGIDKSSTHLAARFFSEMGIKTLETDVISAELGKLFTNMYRYISFAIANEFMVIAENFNRNIHEITHMVNDGYKRGGLVLPGLSAGPCLFKDGFFLINENPFLDLITASWKVNEALPLFILKKLRERVILRGKKTTILGLAFKPEIDDIRESLSFKIRKALLREHARITLHDPYVKEYRWQPIVHDLKKSLRGAQVVIIATRHKQYVQKKAEIINNVDKNTYICDIWNIFNNNKMIFKAGQVEKFFDK